MKKIRIFTTVLLLIVAINALVAGYMFMEDPTGSKLKISVSVFANSPFNDFFIPGIVLFTLIGIMNAIAALFTILEWKYYQLLIVIQSVILLGWILIQVMMLQETNLLHYALAGTGSLLFMLGNRLNV
jgi:hypothetical protein